MKKNLIKLTCGMSLDSTGNVLVGILLIRGMSLDSTGNVLVGILLTCGMSLDSTGNAELNPICHF
jgi:hypothetical protein